MTLELQKIDVTGDPSDVETVVSVQLTYADTPDLNSASEWMKIQLKPEHFQDLSLVDLEMKILEELTVLIRQRLLTLRER